MADSFIQLPTDTSLTGKLVRTATRTVGTNTVHEHFLQINDSTNNTQCRVLTGDAASTDGGLAVHLTPATNTLGAISIGCSTGKTNQCNVGSLATSATTPAQVILSYTVPAAQIYYVQGLDAMVHPTTMLGANSYFGTARAQFSVSGTIYADIYSADLMGITGDRLGPIAFAEPMPIAAGATIRVVCDPAAATAYNWKANLFGYTRAQ